MHKHNKIGHAPLTAARPWDDSAWTGAVFCAGPRTVYDMQTIVILELGATPKPDTEALVGGNRGEKDDSVCGTLASAECT